MGFVKLTPQQLKDDPEQQLRSMKKTKDFLVAIDTDGCVADNMNGKHMVIFQPHYMEFYQLWPIESYFREVAEYYNLFSDQRGCNRFLATLYTLKALHGREDALQAAGERGVELPSPDFLEDYIHYCEENGLGLGNPSLEKYIAGDPMNLYLYKLLGWSEAVNRTFPHVKIPPFDNVKECLELMSARADIIVVSQTPYEDLVNFWEGNGLLDYIVTIAGQEMGKKSHHIELAKKACGYRDDKVLMLGDAMGDMKAVKDNNGLFYPVPAGLEDSAWEKLPSFFQKFLQGSYSGDAEEELISLFNRTLLKSPPWEKEGYDHEEAYKSRQDIRKKIYSKINPGGRLFLI